ncbi:MAG: hypothetical protein ABR587_12145 [Candidatus Binatia bacterium]
MSRQSLQCWKAKDLKNPAFLSQDDVTVADELSTSPADVKSPALYCLPAGIDGVVASNPDPTMCCYKATGAKLATAARRRTLGLEFGSLDVELSKRSLVCEQCGGSVATEQSLQCWKTKDLKNPKFTPREDVPVTDAFATGTADVKKPAFYCAPAAVGLVPVGDSSAHQCCYKAKSSSVAPPAPVDASGELGGTFQVGVGKPLLVCEPCTSTALP